MKMTLFFSLLAFSSIYVTITDEYLHDKLYACNV
uniref:Uncharacterized protein n=1 Tax=Siphoviridae sp. ctBCr48 TaxID=2827802 RepID=A0A8S5SH85_9CAUD|nr:MAG TPA: hypothetical protein [Siphoviridae sp. ctBCr48]